MNILVTGGSGFIGSNLCEHLLEKDHIIVNIDNHNSYYDPKIKELNIKNALNNSKYNFISGDIRDKELIDKIVKKYKIKCIIHLAAMAGVRPSIIQPELYFDVNINGTLNILESAKKHKIKRVLFASSSSVYGNNKKIPFSETDSVDNPISPYAATKKAGELMCYTYHTLYNIDIACLRFFTVYGSCQRPEMAIHLFTDSIIKGKSIKLFNHGQCKRDFTYIDDIIDGIIKILDYRDLGFDIVNLGDSFTIKTIDLVQKLEQLLSLKSKKQLLPPQAGDVDITFADISHANKRYNYSPSVSLDVGLAKFIDWYKLRMNNRG